MILIIWSFDTHFMTVVKYKKSGTFIIEAQVEVRNTPGAHPVTDLLEEESIIGTFGVGNSPGQ